MQKEQVTSNKRMQSDAANAAPLMRGVMLKKTMHLRQAIKKSRRQIITGWIISISALIILVMSCVLTLYYMTLGSNVFDKPLNQIALTIFQNTQFLGLKYLWKIVPVIYYPEIFTIKNLGFAAIICLLIFGVVMRDSGIKLAKRLNKKKDEAEEDQWLQSLEYKPVKESLKNEPVEKNGFRPIIIQISNKENWYTRPPGIISLAIIAGYLVNLLSKLSGL